MKAQLVKWGNSLAVRIPRHVIEEAGLKEGDVLEIEAADNYIELRPKVKVPSLAKLVAEITDQNRYSEISIGQEIGKESVEW
jgi:antitoxin MazE